ncbi:hypothetical protein G6O69_09495 [Pseudenhygromyxa sp. WMMC2535]|uniref:hypothetical protein n=1 Tax=Pseudenhygromyxa sp. WMMC2535 TaxID=2712867 RepID=UPI00155452F5|nr:hypothetical protein [Pseudenhygromyxa sp. WMMC2535]NVB38065.1 hypothetical protein [Pseudenhygromyxa sp. WMMC2535]
MTSPTADPQTSPASGQSPGPSTDADNDFRLDFRVRGGDLMATLPGLEPDDDPVEIHEYMTWLRVRGDLGLAMMVLSRHNGDLEGRPVGLFYVKLSAAELGDLRQRVESIKWAELPAPTGGDVTASTLELDYSHGSLLIRRQFNARNREFIAAIWPVMEALNAKQSGMLAAPANTLVVSASGTDDPAKAGASLVQVSLTNTGRGPVTIVDPRVPNAAGEARIELLFTAASQDPRPPTWAAIPLPALAEGAPEQVTIPAGGSLKIPTTWQAQPGDYYLRGEWKDYVGPNPAQLPVMPLGDVIGEPHTAHSLYIVRGAAFSKGTPFTVT